jgi:hypothetical protein
MKKSQKESTQELAEDIIDIKTEIAIAQFEQEQLVIPRRTSKRDTEETVPV